MMVLEGIRVLDFSRYIAGPYAGMLMADMGAEVIRVESPGGAEDRTLGPMAPNGQSLPFSYIIPRNKKSITLDLRSPKAQELLARLVALADVVLENFSPNVKGELGLSYEKLRAANDKIILVSISAYGESGPYAPRVGFDTVFQALSGVMSYTGFPGHPPTRAGIAFVDFSTALSAAWGTTLALYHRQQTGEGQKVELALLDTAISLMASMGVAAECQLLGFLRPQIGNTTFYAFGDCFQARDGWVVLSVLGNPLFRRFAQTIGHPQLSQDPRFQDDISRFYHRRDLLPLVQAWIKERTTAQVEEAMAAARVPCGRVNTVAETVADPQVKARGMLVGVEYEGVGQVPQPGVHVRLSRTPGRVRTKAPRVGQHNQEVYGKLLGLTGEEIRGLKKDKVI